MTKPTKWHVRPAKTQVSLGIHPVWSESSLSAWRKLGSLATHWVHSEGSDQTGRTPRLIWSSLGAQSFCWFCHEAAHLSIFLFPLHQQLHVVFGLVRKLHGHLHYYAPNFKEVDGAYWFRVVRPCVCVQNMHAISYESCMLGFWNFIYGFLMEK